MSNTNLTGLGSAKSLIALRTDGATALCRCSVCEKPLLAEAPDATGRCGTCNERNARAVPCCGFLYEGESCDCSITTRIPLPVIVAETCAKFFGTRARKYADNQCGKCPLRAPCSKHGSTVARNNDTLEASRHTFIAESLAILEAA